MQELEGNLKPETPETSPNQNGLFDALKGFVAKMACSFPTNQAIVVGGGLGGVVGLFVLRDSWALGSGLQCRGWGREQCTVY